MKRLYELVFLLRKDLNIKDLDKSWKEIRELIEGNGGVVEQTEYWGLRDLPFVVKKTNKAYYSMFAIQFDGRCLDKIREKLRYNELVIRYMIIRVEKHDKSSFLKLSDFPSTNSPNSSSKLFEKYKFDIN